MGVNLPAELLTVFSHQHGVAHHRQFAEFGVSRARVRRAVHEGWLIDVVPGVVGLRTTCSTFESRVHALQLASVEGSFATGRTAGRLHGLRRMQWRQVEWAIPYRTRFAAPAWAVVSRVSWPDDEPRPTRDDGLWVASPRRTMLELAARLHRVPWRWAAEDAWHLGLIDPDSLAEYVQRVRRSGRAGVTPIVEWLEEVADRRRTIESGLEQLGLELCERAGLPEPERQFPVVLASGRTIHLDLAWPEIRFSVEPGHSWFHGGDDGQRRDQRRDRQLAQVGWLNFRFDETVQRHHDEVMRELRAAYWLRHRDVAG